jgi:hypothetical protein
MQAANLQESTIQDEQRHAAPLERGAFGMPKPQGWPLERVTGLIAGVVVLTTLALGRLQSSRWRILTGFVGANLILNATAGWCPASVLLHRFGRVPTVAERERGHHI